MAAVNPCEAAPTAYHPEPGTGQSGVRFKVPYSLGTHEGKAKAIRGAVQIDFENLAATSGLLEVPINYLSTDDAERDCHMREALGLDYAKSGFPEEHVCGDDDRLPETGNNAVAYPTIQFKITAARSLEPSGKVLPQGETSIEVDGEWTIHGVSRHGLVPLKVSSAGEKLRVQGRVPFSLKAHGIEVKSAKILFLTIRVEDKAVTELDLLLAPDNAAPKK